MTHDASDGPERKKPERPRRRYVTPRLIDYGAIAQITRSLAQGSYQDATHMAASMCSGQCQ